MSNKKIVIIGPGAIGGSLAAFISKAGYDITLVANRDTTRDLISTRGIHISGIKGELYVKVNCVSKVSELKETFDYAFIATKAYVLEEVAIQLMPFLKETSLVVSLQNGICTDLLANVVGANRTIGCVIGYGATMLQRGDIEITSTGEFIIGRISECCTSSLEELAKIMSSLFPVTISTSLYNELYSKLIVNSCITSLGAASGLKLGEMMKQYKARKIFLGIIDEAMNVANKLNIEVPPYAGKLNYYGLIKRSFFNNFKRHIIIMIVGKKYKNLKSSSLQSLQRGEVTEINFFNGYISFLGKKCDIQTPLNDAIINLIHEIEQGKESISSHNFDKLIPYVK